MVMVVAKRMEGLAGRDGKMKEGKGGGECRFLKGNGVDGMDGKEMKVEEEKG